MSKRVKVSPLQKEIFRVEDDGNVTYLINGFPQSYQELLEYDPNFEDFDDALFEPPIDILGFNTELPNKATETKLDKEDDRTIQLTISDLEKIRRILTSIPQFTERAVQEGKDIEDIDTLAAVLHSVDFMSLPCFEIDMSIFDILPKNNPEYRQWIFCSILEIINQVKAKQKLPTKQYLKRIFIDFNDEQIEQVYNLIKRLLSLLNAWGGIQIHYFQQLIRDWLYITYEKGNAMSFDEILQYLRARYPCKSDYEINCLANIIANSNSFAPSFDDFVDEVLRFFSNFSPEPNQYLTEQEVYLLWSSDFLRSRITTEALKWKERIRVSRITESQNALDDFFGVSNRLSLRAREGILPEEVGANDSANETLIKVKLYFPQGHRTLVEARIDRFVRTKDGVYIYDWKTKRKPLEEMNDFEKLQIILQCIAVQNVTQSTRPSQAYTPMVNDDYRFFLTQTNTAFVRPSTLPLFFHIPEQTDDLFDYVELTMPPEEVKRILDSFAIIVDFLICNKKVMSKLKNHLKKLESAISAPRLREPEVQKRYLPELVAIEG